MDNTNRCSFATIIWALIVIIAASRCAHGQEGLGRRLLEASQSEQTAWIISDLDDGMQSNGDALALLALNKSATTLPLIERKIEQVLRCPSPSQCFASSAVDPQRFVALAASMIAYPGNSQSLEEARKLIRIDEKRFGYLVERILGQARDFRNPFTVTYEGFNIGDPAIDSRIAAWAERGLLLSPPPPPKDYSRVPGGELLRLNDVYTRESMIREARTRWAEAMVDKYGGVPSEAQWRNDPLVSKLKPVQADSVHDEMIRHALEVVEKRAQRPSSAPR